MNASARPVTVRTASGQEIRYDWATSVTVTRKGDLKVLQGWRQRAFPPAGEWVQYTVDAAPVHPGIRAAADRERGQHG